MGNTFEVLSWEFATTTTLKNYLTIVVICVAVLVSHTIQAETVIQIHTVSYHENREANFNENNIGIGFRSYTDKKRNEFLTAGAYKNSEYNQSLYAGIGREWGIKNISISIDAGFVTGYASTEYIFYILPSVRYKNISLNIVPYPEKVILLTFDVFTF